MYSYEIPLISGAQRLTVRLGTRTYTLGLSWCSPINTWMLSINEDDGKRILSNLPLVADTNLLEPYADLGMGGGLIAHDTNSSGEPISYEALGRSAKLYFVTMP